MEFEVKATDLAGRIGRFNVGGKCLETPIYLPVIHPVNQAIPAADIYSMGFKAVITNAYITYKKYGDLAKEKKIHNIIGFPGTVMTDSGGYQILEYGEVDVPTVSIAKYQREIGSDIAVILDTPTGYRAKRERALRTVELTIKAAEESVEVIKKGGPLWAGPVQGGDHLDLVAYSARKMSSLPFDLFAIGSPVEIMNSYDFKTLVKIVLTAKENLPSSKPIHLFGAGHPLTMALTVAMGCDLFDSASYVLFAKEGRYMTPYGVSRLLDMNYLPCSCPICNKGIDDLKSLPEEERMKRLALHNLYVLKGEMEGIKQAIKEGRLWEYVMQKARSHPALHTAVDHMVKHGAKVLEDGTPLFKKRALFLFDHLDVHRPEVIRHYKRMDELSFSEKMAVIMIPRSYDANIFTKLRRNIDKILRPGVAFFLAAPFFSLIPLEIHDVYPLSQNVFSDRKDGLLPEELEAYRKVLTKFEKVTIVYEAGMDHKAKSVSAIAEGMNKKVELIGPTEVIRWSVKYS